MLTETYPQVINKKRSFLSTAVMSVGTILTTALLCATSVVVYGMNIVDNKSSNLIELAESVVSGVPGILENLPPLLSDLTHDERRPEYAGRIEVSARVVPVEDRRGRGVRPVIEVTNRGDQLVTLLSMRVVLLNEHGAPVSESNEWAATPLALDDGQCCGPLMPGAKRYLRGQFRSIGDKVNVDDLSAAWEISDVRVWTGEGKTPKASVSANQGRRDSDDRDHDDDD